MVSAHLRGLLPTRNALVEQGTLPSTGLLTHNNYWNAVISNSYTFSPTGWATLCSPPACCTLPRRATRILASRWPSLSALPRSPSPGSKPLATTSSPRPSPFFPICAIRISTRPLRPEPRSRQPRAQVWGRLHPRARAQRRVCLHRGAVHPVSVQPRLLHRPARRRLRRHHLAAAVLRYFGLRAVQPSAQRGSGITCTYTPAGDGSFSQNVQRLALYGEDSWRVSHHFTLNYGLRYQTTFGLFEGSGRSQTREQRLHHAAGAEIPVVPSVPARLPQANCAASRHDLFAGRQREDRISRGLRALTTTTWRRTVGPPHFRESITPTRPPAPASSLAVPVPTRSPARAACRAALAPQATLSGRLQNSLRDSHYRRRRAAFNQHWLASADYVHEQGNHGYRAFPYTGAPTFSPR